MHPSSKTDAPRMGLRKGFTSGEAVYFQLSVLQRLGSSGLELRQNFFAEEIQLLRIWICQADDQGVESS